MDVGGDETRNRVEAPYSLISPRLYKKIARSVPIFCVDLLIQKDKEFLLVKRKNSPLRGKFWIVGGRVLLGEDPLEAAHRKAKEEVGLELDGITFVGYLSDIFNKNSFESTEYHTISIVYLCHPKHTNVMLDDQSSEWKWGELPQRFLDTVSWSKTTYGSIYDPPSIPGAYRE